MRKDNGKESAFPVEYNSRTGGIQDFGLTKREYAAIQIMAGMNIHDAIACDYHKETARWAVQYADALFSELEKEKK